MILTILTKKNLPAFCSARPQLFYTSGIQLIDLQHTIFIHILSTLYQHQFVDKLMLITYKFVEHLWSNMVDVGIIAYSAFMYYLNCYTHEFSSELRTTLSRK